MQYAPCLAHNLLSVGQLILNGYSILFDNESCSIQHKQYGSKIFHVQMTTNRMFSLDVSVGIENSALVVKVDLESNLWHLRYGHLNNKGLQLLVNKDMVVGLPKIHDISFCEGCVYGKQARTSFPVGKTWRASTHLELVHADLCGPMSVESIGGSRYFLLFIDDYSRMSWVFFLKYKSQAFEYFKKFK